MIATRSRSSIPCPRGGQPAKTHPVSAAEPARPAAPAPAKDPVAEAQRGDVSAYFGKGSKISGKLNFEGTVRLDGKVDGEIHAKDSLVIGESAEVTAEIHAKSIVVLGVVRGDIRASQRLELRAPARLYGNVETPTLVIQEGVIFEGSTVMENLGAKSEGKVQPLERKDKDAGKGSAPAQQQKAKHG